MPVGGALMPMFVL